MTGIYNNLMFILAENMTSEQRRENYLCDITYVTNSELGFDFLRDNLATESTLIFTRCFELFSYCSNFLYG